jgi:hypothetical protein
LTPIATSCSSGYVSITITEEIFNYQSGSSLTGLNDVLIPSPVTSDIVMYDGVQNKFVNMQASNPTTNIMTTNTGQTINSQKTFLQNM